MYLLDASSWCSYLSLYDARKHKTGTIKRIVLLAYMQFFEAAVEILDVIQKIRFVKHWKQFVPISGTTAQIDKQK